MGNLFYEFKIGAFIQLKDGTITRIPNLGWLKLNKLSVRGGEKRTFNADTTNLMPGTKDVSSLGAEIQEALNYKNILILRDADVYSNDFHSAYINKSKFIALISLRGYRKSKSKSTLLSSALIYSSNATIKTYTYSSYGNNKIEKMNINFKKLTVNYGDPMLVLETFGEFIKLGKNGLEKAVSF